MFKMSLFFWHTLYIGSRKLAKKCNYGNILGITYWVIVNNKKEELAIKYYSP